MGYYDNPDRILIGVDINTHIDLFEENWSDMTGGKDFDWDKDGDVFNKMSAEFDRIVENCIAKKLGHTAVEEFHDGNDYGISVYTCTFWGDKNNPEDINVLEELQDMADDKWTDNGRVQLAIYGDDIFMSEIDSFLDKWGEKGTEYGVMADALTDSITIGVDFPEEFDSDPMYEKVNGMSIKNSKQIKSSVTKDISSFTVDNVAEYLRFPLEEMITECWESLGFDPKEDVGGDADEFMNILDILANYVVKHGKEWHGLNSSRKPVKSSVEGLTFDNKTNTEYNDFVQYKVNNQKTLDKIK